MQLRRVSISVVSNLAGSATKTAKGQAYFTNIAYSSLVEILNQMIITTDLNFITKDVLSEGRLKIEYLTQKVAGLRKLNLLKQV